MSGDLLGKCTLIRPPNDGFELGVYIRCFLSGGVIVSRLVICTILSDTRTMICVFSGSDMANGIFHDLYEP